MVNFLKVWTQRCVHRRLPKMCLKEAKRRLLVVYISGNTVSSRQRGYEQRNAMRGKRWHVAELFLSRGESPVRVNEHKLQPTRAPSSASGKQERKSGFQNKAMWKLAPSYRLFFHSVPNTKYMYFSKEGETINVLDF